MYYSIDFIDNGYEGALYLEVKNGRCLVGYVNPGIRQVQILVDYKSVVDYDSIGERVARILGESEPYNVITIYDF